MHFTALALLLAAAPLRASRILAIFPTVSKSHFDFFQPLILALASRGHHITVINSFPQTPPVGNYTDISVRDFKKIFFNDIAFDQFYDLPISWYDNQLFLHSQVENVKGVFDNTDVKILLSSDKLFDLVMVEYWNNDIALGFASRFRVPVIAMSSCNILPWHNGRFGNPDDTSYIPNIFLARRGNLDLWGRVLNTVQVASAKLFYRLFFQTKSDRIAKEVFGDSLPPLDELARQSSLMLVNIHHSYFGPRPLSPQVVEVGGLHVKQPQPLPDVSNRTTFL